MRRVFLGGVVLLLCAAIAARSKSSAPGKPAGTGKRDPLVFVFLRVEPAHDVAILRPMIAPEIGVQLESGPARLERGTVLRCEASAREHHAIVEGQVGKVREILLDCGERKFIVKTLDFAPHAK